MTDGWGAYERHVEAEQHTVGKAHTQKIESKHINVRTRIKRLVRRTICFSKTEQMHDFITGHFWVCPTFYTPRNSTRWGPFPIKSATSQERYFIA